MDNVTHSFFEIFVEIVEIDKLVVVLERQTAQFKICGQISTVKLKQTPPVLQCLLSL